MADLFWHNVVVAAKHAPFTMILTVILCIALVVMEGYLATH